MALGLASQVAVLLAVGRCADWNSRLCRWGTGAAHESIAQTFSNQALNTLANYASKGLSLLDGSWFPASPAVNVAGQAQISVSDARQVAHACDFWVTDPPYADAIVYDELSEFFLAGTKGRMSRFSPTGMPTAAVPWRSAAPITAFRDAWSSATASWPTTCPTTACRWSCSRIRTRPSGPTWP